MATSRKPTTVSRLTELSEPTLESILDVLEAAFSEDEFTSIVLANDPSLRRLFVKPMIQSAFAAGEVWLAYEEQKIVGVAAWFPPGRYMYDSEDQRDF
ncbi:hypothetical protein DL96DRAFT_1614887 [Flagelloscypha sp. PMI_526]|nr:hypothetical protein DL96DRAFT_1614887 [Flagelloscypha sp. PMI_526]